MKQKLRILTLSFLLVMQSFFGLAPITLAEGSGGDVVEEVVDDDEVESGEETVGKEEEKKSDSSEEDSSTTESELVEGNDEGEAEAEEEAEADEGVESTEEKENNDSEVMEGKAGGIQPFNFTLTNFPEEIELDNTNIKNVTFKVNNQLVAGTSADVRNGQNAEFTIYLENIGVDENDRNYGPGTKLKYELPSGFAQVFDGISVGGTFGGLGNLSVESGYIVIELTEEIADGFGGSKPIENGFFTINAQLSNNNTDWDKQVEILGGTTITLNFQPKQGTGTTINKSNGTYDESVNEISWTVIVNTNLNNHESGTVTFTDTLTATGDLDSDSAGHKYDTNSVEVYEIEVTPQGPNESVTTPSGISPTFSNNDTQMSLLLEKDKAYKIEYKTIPDNPGINESVTYRNAANYGGSPATGTFTKNYGKAIEKSVKTAPSGTNLTTTWQINYNFHNQVVPSGTELTDNWTISGGAVPTGQTGYLKMENLEIYQANGTTPWNGNYYLDYNDEDSGFTIVFYDNVTEPLVITYDTTPVNLYATSNFTVSNTANHGHITQATSTASQQYSQDAFALVKNTVGSVPNYQAKTMDWVITANQAGYNLAANTTFTDTFENENMYLKAETLKVKIGNTTHQYDPVNPSATNGVFTLTNNHAQGFTITLVNSTTSQVTISYTTDYVIKEVEDGTGRGQNYPNKVKLTSSSLPNEPTSERSYTINAQQKANGNKTGSYNYETKTFHWEVVFNYNYNTINEAVFKDLLPANHKITSISVTKGDLTAGGAFNDSSAETVTINDSTIIDTNQIDLNLGTITKPHKVVYTSKVTNDIIPETTGNYKVTNVAELYNGTTRNASWGTTVTVLHTQNVLAQKNGSQIGTTMGIKWNFYFNTAQSSLNNVVIADTFAKDNGVPNQIIDPSSVKVYKVQFNGTNSSLNNRVLVPKSEYTLSFEDPSYPDAAFVLKLGNVNKAYYIEYESVFIGLKNSPISNTVEVKYFDTQNDSRSSSKSNLTFNYGSNASTSAARFVIVKTDAATGEPMKDVEFTLLNRNDRELLTGTTNEHGVLDFGYALATGTYKLKEKPVVGYQSLGNYSFVLSTNDIEAGGTHQGKQVVRVENIPEGTTLCNEFTLTAKDVDGKPVPNVTFINLETGKEYSKSNGANGTFTFPKADLPAGKYTVKTNDNGTTVTLAETVTVKYANGCEAEVQPAKTCPVFTVMIKDGNEAPRIGGTIKFVDAIDSSKEIEATELQDGKYSVPNTTKAGLYKVYDGNQYLGEVTVTYKNGCGATVIEAPKCEVFTLTVNDVDGNPRDAAITIVVKEKGTNTVVATKTTDANGKVVLENLKPGEYEVYKDGESQPFAEFASNTSCSAGVQPEPACPEFTITVNDENGNPRKNVTATVKDQAGNEIRREPTDENGNITVPSKDLPAGTYDLYEGGIFLGKVEVSYKGTCEAGVDTTVPNAGTCPNFALTIQDSAGNPRSAVQVTIQDANGNEVEDANGNKTFTTAQDGKIKLGNIKPGKYDVYENGTTKIGSFTADNTCGATVKPAPIIPPVATCANFTVTVKQGSTSVGANVKLTLKSSTTEKAVTTDSTGQIVIDKTNLPEGTYKVYDKGGKEVGTITVHYQNNCNATIQLGGTDLKITLKADPETIVADGKSQSTLTAKVTDEDGKPVEGVTVVFEAGKGSFPSGNTAVTDENGNASVILKSEKIEDIKTHEIPVKATVHDTEKGLYAEDRITIIFEPSSITGVVKDNKTGEPIEGVKVVVTKTFEDGTTFHGEAVTGADGKYKIPIPRGDEQYDVEITKTIIVNGEPEEVTFKQKAEAGEITSDKNDEEFPAEETFTGVVIMKDKNGKDKIVRKDFGEKIVIKQIVSAGTGKQSEINSSGVFTLEGLEKGKPYEFAVIVEVDGKEVIMGKIKVTLDSDGEIRIHEELIDPYGTITDSETGEVIGGAHVELYFADTPRNRGKGRTPDTLVNLPILPGFAPNDNKNPQTSVSIPVWSDEAGDHGNYAWMVFPEGDYYIVAKKPGYKDYISPTISVEYDIVKHDFEMEPIPSSDDDTPSDGTPGGNTPGTPGGETPGTPGGNRPGTPGGETPGTPGGNRPGTPGGETPGTPGGNTPGTPGGKTPVTPGGKTPGIPGGETPVTPGGKTPGIPGGETPITPGGNTPGTFDDGNVEYPKNSNELEKNNSLVELERNKPSGQLSKQGGVDKSISQSGNSLPQTGEERNLLLLFAGIVFIVVGALLISFRRKTKAL